MSNNIIPLDGNIFDFEAFRKATGLEITSIGVGCDACGNRFGIKIYKDMKNISAIHPKRWLCEVCKEKNEKIELVWEKPNE